MRKGISDTEIFRNHWLHDQERIMRLELHLVFRVIQTLFVIQRNIIGYFIRNNIWMRWMRCRSRNNRYDGGGIGKEQEG